MDFHQYAKRSHYEEDLENLDTNNLSSDDDDIFDEKLISEIKSRSCLYLKTADCKESTKAWNDVAAALDARVDDCKYRWRRLKQYFCKERLKRESGDTSGKKFRLYEKMIFLDAHVYKRKNARKKRKSIKVGTDDDCQVEMNSLEVDKPTPSNTSKERIKESVLLERPLEQTISINELESLDLNLHQQQSNKLANDSIENIAEDDLSESDHMKDDSCHGADTVPSDNGSEKKLKCSNSLNQKSQILKSLTKESANTQSNQFQSKLQNEYQDMISKIVGISSQRINNTIKKDEENTFIAKLITAKLRKIEDENIKKEFKLNCMKILYDN